MTRRSIGHPSYAPLFDRIPDTLPPGEFSAALKAEDARLTADLQAQAAGPWFPELGRALVTALSGIKEAVIRKVLGTIRWDERRIAVVALGGLSRRELAPGSDLDLLILYDAKLEAERFVGVFLYRLWDCGYEVTAGTRAIGECLAHALDDETFFTALLSARYLAGSRELFEKLMRCFSRIVHRRGMKLISGWLAETREAANGHPSLFGKEPNLKKAPGGLRGVHVLEWLAAIHRCAPGTAELERVLPPSDQQNLERARDFLLTLRVLLHFYIGGREDTLALDYQLPLARSLCLAGDDIEKVRTLMRAYYKKVLAINRILFRFAESIWIRTPPVMKRIRNNRLGSRAWISGGTLFLPPLAPFEPVQAWDVLERLASERLLFSASVSGWLENGARGYTEQDRRPLHRERLIRLLDRPYAAQSLTAMHFSGWLRPVLPVMLPVRYFYLAGPSHLSPVDVHSIAAVAALEQLYADELPASVPGFIYTVREVASLYREKAWVIKLALLLHDAGKGFPGDHSKNGVEEAVRFLPGLGITRQYQAAVLFMIEHHLLLAAAVRGRDPADERVVEDLAWVFIRSPYPEEYLDLLFIFTFADVWATNPRYYNGYFALTLTRVCQKVRERLLRQPKAPGAPESAEDRFPPDGPDGQAISSFARDMGQRYLENNDDAAVWHDYAILSGLGADGFEIGVRAENEYLSATFYAPDRPGLFALLAGILSLNGAAIVRAEIHTSSGKALDEFSITGIFESDSVVFSGGEDAARWEAALRRDYALYKDDPGRLSGALAFLKEKTRVLGERFTQPAQVVVVPQSRNGLLLEVSGRDRPALLFDLAWALAQERMEVESAFIDTTGWSVRDVFTIRSVGGLDAADQKRLIGTLEKILAGDEHRVGLSPPDESLNLRPVGP